MPDAKLTKYLLNLQHPSGASKARFFIAHGFDPEVPTVLATALLLHADTYPVSELLAHLHGVSRVIVGELVTPDGRNPHVRVIWVQDGEADLHRLVTAYPA